MRRRSSDSWVQVNLRIKESLRRELEAHAKENQVSFNQEVRTRLAESLEQKTRQSLESLVSDLGHKSRDIELAWRRFDALATETVQRMGSPDTLTKLPRQEKKEGGKA
jgi:hypothetical protein